MRNTVQGRVVAAVLGLFVLCAADTAFATVRIGGSAFAANGQVARNYEYSGPCPVDLKFDWGIVGTEAGPVRYAISRSDGAHTTAPQTINLPAPNRSEPAVDEWHLGANSAEFANFRGWAQINILSPNPVNSRISFTLHCGEHIVRPVETGNGGHAVVPVPASSGGHAVAPVDAGMTNPALGPSGDGAVLVVRITPKANGSLIATHEGPNREYTGSCPVELSVDWGIRGAPGTVQYQFARSDGAQSGGPRQVHLTTPNEVMPIVDVWRLGTNTPEFADFHGWMELVLESPTRSTSRVPFVLHCQGSEPTGRGSAQQSAMQGGGAPIAGSATHAVRIGGSAFFVKGQLTPNHAYAGTCPVDLRLEWSLISDQPVTAQYEFVRSDGARSTMLSINLPGGRHSTPIVDTWQLGTPGDPRFVSFNGWVELNVVSPEHLVSRQGFVVRCQ